MICFQLLDIFFDLLDVFFEEHQPEADGQQQAGEPDGLGPAEVQRHAAEGRTQREQEDDGKVVERFVLGGAVARHEPAAQGVHAAAQIADAHGAGKGVAVHLAEGLYLHCTGEGDEGVGHQIPFLREEAHHEEHQDLAQHHQLPPVEPLHLPEFLAQQLRRKNAQREEAERHQIAQHGFPVAFDQLHAAQHDVAGLGVGEHFAAV